MQTVPIYTKGAMIPLPESDGEGEDEMSSVRLLKLARILNEEGNSASAIKTLCECLRQNPDFGPAARLLRVIKKAEALKKEGNDAYKAGKLEAAMVAYEEALTLDSTNKLFNSRIHANCAAVQMKQGKVSASICSCDASIELDDTYVKAYLRRAQAYMSKIEEEVRSNAPPNGKNYFCRAIRDYSKVNQLLKDVVENRQLLAFMEVGLQRARRLIETWGGIDLLEGYAQKNGGDVEGMKLARTLIYKTPSYEPNLD